MAGAVGEIDWDHLGRIGGGRVTVGVGAHFASSLDFGEGGDEGGEQTVDGGRDTR